MSEVLIFGGTGSLGRKLIERLLPGAPVAVYSRDEAKHWSLKNEFLAGPLAYRLPHLQFFVGDVRDQSRVREVIRRCRPETIIIAAALKQVDTCEMSPGESVLTNLIGTQNIIDVVNNLTQSSVKRVLFVSTDKACSPINVYGMCKAISERVVTSQVKSGNDAIKYLAVRYGNVLESRGSIIPLFKHQGMYSECLTVTDPEMTRFVMTLDDSVDLIHRALMHGNSGETWIPKLPAMKIGDLAQIFAEHYKKPIKVVGLRPGEKKHEDLINESESIRTNLTEDGLNYVIGPSFDVGTTNRFTFSSSDIVMDFDSLKSYLDKLGIIDAPLENFRGLSIEEIPTNRKK